MQLWDSGRRESLTVIDSNLRFRERNAVKTKEKTSSLWGALEKGALGMLEKLNAEV